MALAGVELRYLVERMTKETDGYYVSNIYGIDRNSVLFKLHHPEKSDLMLVISTTGMWLTDVRIRQIEENRMVRRLRSDLLRLRITDIEQPDLERLAYLKFSGFEKEFVLVGEFFGDGNLILCSDAMKVLALQHSIDVRHRTIKVGLQYEPPPGPEKSALHMTRDDFQGIIRQEGPCARWLGRSLGVPRRYAEGIACEAGIDPRMPCVRLDDDNISALYEAARSVIRDVIDGHHTPIIIRHKGVEVSPVTLKGMEGEEVGGFMEALDKVFTDDILERGRQEQGGEDSAAETQLQRRLAEQEKAIRTVQDRAAAMTATANALYRMLSSGVLRLDMEGADTILAETGASLVYEKGAAHISVMDQKVLINLEAPLQSTASILYGEAKRQVGAVPAIQKMMEKTRRQAGRAAGKAEARRSAVVASEVRKRNWFERYRWFYTSDGLLAIGGRDAPSNSAVVRKHMESRDRVFHAEIFGSPFFILKDGDAEPGSSMGEVAHATVCFSRVWREAMHGSSAYWVMPEQVKKSAPTGQFLPKGSFTIEGRRNFMRPPGLQLAVGIMKHEDEPLLVCGPPAAVTSHTQQHVIIEPGGLEMVATAKKIRTALLDMGLECAGQYTIDEYIRVLPAGKSRVVTV